jgi:hypothetical protein
MRRHHLAQPLEARCSALLVHQEGRVERAGGILHRHHQIVFAGIAGQPSVRRGVLMQHHAHHWPTRPLLAVSRSLLGPLHQTLAMQMQLGHRVAQRIMVPLEQLLVEVRCREAAIEIAIQTQHPLDLRHRRPAQRWRQTPIVQTRQPRFPMPIAPAAERPFADTQQLRRFHLAQLRPP